VFPQLSGHAAPHQATYLKLYWNYILLYKVHSGIKENLVNNLEGQKLKIPRTFEKHQEK